MTKHLFSLLLLCSSVAAIGQSDSKIALELELIAADMRKYLPYRDGHLTLISAEFVPPSSLKMTHQFDVSYSQFDYSLLPSLKEQVKQIAISNENFAEIRRMGATMIFEYLEKNKLYVTTVIVTPNDYN